jgi:iron-sulfur cluster assembly accessory protein
VIDLYNVKRMETPTAAVTVSDTAADKIRELVASGEQEQALRVAVRGGGCSGFQYALALDRPKDEDHVFQHNGVSVVVDKTSMQFVFGSQVDYVDGLQGAGFTVNNPNVVAACGCGSSFQVREDAAEQAAV